MATKALLTEDGALFLEFDSPDVGPGDDPMFSDGDIETSFTILDAEGIKVEQIDDVDARPELADRVARIREALKALED